MEQIFLRNSEPLFFTKHIPAYCSQQQITDRNSEPQEHSSHHHNKSDLREINVTEDENSEMAIGNKDAIKFI
jgi:hypothetical protein